MHPNPPPGNFYDPNMYDPDMYDFFTGVYNGEIDFPVPDRVIQSFFDPEVVPPAEHFGEAPPGEQQIPGRLPRGSVVCYVTWCAFAAMAGSLGEGSPDPGDRLVGSSSMFNDISAQIAALVPNGDWQGSAAQVYVAQNHVQSQRAKVMGDLDHLSAGLVSAQAKIVEEVRTHLYVTMGVIGAVGLGCLALEESGWPLLSLGVAFTVCLNALMIVGTEWVALAIVTSQNGSKLQGLTQSLTEMVTTLPALSDTNPGFPDAALPASPTRSEFDAAHTVNPTIAVLPDDTAPFPEAPDICLALADLPGSPEFSVPELPSPGFPDFGVSRLPIPHLAGMPSLPDALPGGLPIVPTTNELTALAELSGASAALPTRGLANTPAMARVAVLTNMPGQQVQMISSLAQQGTHPQATLVDQLTQNDGAAAANTTAQRAPADTANKPYPTEPVASPVLPQGHAVTTPKP